MYLNIVRVFAVLTLAGSLACCLAATPAIGMVSAGGSFRMDGVTVFGNATLFDGTLIETGRAPSELQWLHGGRMILGADSRGTVRRDRLVLERGQGQIAAATTYPIEAASLRILAAQPDSTALVALDGPRQIRVSALAGPVRVINTEGTLVANIAPGKALEMEAQAAGAAAPSVLTGTILQRGGHYLLTDETTGVTVELTGEDLDRGIRKRVEITGTLDTLAQPIPGVGQTIRVIGLKVLGNSAAAGTGAGAAGGGAKGAATAARTSRVATIAGIAAVAAPAGVAIGLTAGGGNTFGSGGSGSGTGGAGSGSGGTTLPDTGTPPGSASGTGGAGSGSGGITLPIGGPLPGSASGTVGSGSGTAGGGGGGTASGNSGSGSGGSSGSGGTPPGSGRPPISR